MHPLHREQLFAFGCPQFFGIFWTKLKIKAEIEKLLFEERQPKIEKKRKKLKIFQHFLRGETQITQ